jgi:predicted transcriptional regulator of viral defense system
VNKQLGFYPKVFLKSRSSDQVALDLFRENGGTLRTSEALRLGIHPRTLYGLRDSGKLERLSRGLYRIAELPPLSHPDLVIVAQKIPHGVICLVSALAFHGLTTQIPHAVDVALRPSSHEPTLDYPPLRTFWFSGLAWNEGVETHTLDSTLVRVYNPAKSVADIFKYRRKLGLDVALEALSLYRQRRDFEVGTLLHYAEVDRVEKAMRPYLEALL